MIIVANIIGFIILWITYAVIVSVVVGALVGITKGKLPTIIGAISTITGSIGGVILTFILLNIFDQKLSFIPIIIWGVFLLIAISKDTVNWNAQISPLEKTSYELGHANEKTNYLVMQRDISNGQFMGLILGLCLSLAFIFINA